MTKAALILFITRLNATAVIEKAAEVLTAHPACTDSLASENPIERRDYRFTSPTDPPTASLKPSRTTASGSLARDARAAAGPAPGGMPGFALFRPAREVD